MTLGVWKPWFLYRPQQIVRRILAGGHPSTSAFSAVDTSWGARVIVDPTKAIGQSIETTGLFDLTVSELLARLIDAGDTVIDAGANVGYMTILAATAAGRGGRVLAFEPHPELFAVLQQNAAYAARSGCHVEARPVALGEHHGQALLHVSQSFAANDGMATLVDGGLAAVQVPVVVERLDDLVPTGASVLKLDVEGFEAPVLRGAKQLLSERRLRHIVFEDHDVEHSEVVGILKASGYRLFALGWRMRGLVLGPIERGPLAAPFEAPSFLATTAPEDVITRTAPRGWQVLSAGFLRRQR